MRNKKFFLQLKKKITLMKNHLKDKNNIRFNLRKAVNLQNIEYFNKIYSNKNNQKLDKSAKSLIMDLIIVLNS